MFGTASASASTSGSASATASASASASASPARETMSCPRRLILSPRPPSLVFSKHILETAVSLTGWYLSLT
eukprot:2280833-Pleurochrysis_carterae.AAC.1